MSGPRIIPRTPSAYPYPLLIKQILHTPMLYAPEQEIVYRDLVRYTYREFCSRIQRLAAVLASAGIGPGDTVAVLDWDSHRYLECFFAVPMMGAILHTVNIRLSPEQILYTMRHAEDKAVLVHEDFLPLLRRLAGDLDGIQAYILLRDTPAAAPETLAVFGEYEDLLSRADEAFAFPDFSQDAQATIFYTTGTTGEPKGVYYSHYQLVVHTLATAVAMGSFTAQGRFQSGDVYMPLTPMFHVHAWGFPYVAVLLGAKQVYPGRYEPQAILELVAREGVTFSHCVPTILHMLIHHPLAQEVDLSRWKVAIGGAAFPRGLARDALALGMDVYAAYGMSETCPVLTVANLKPRMLDWDRERQLDFRIKTGFPIPMVEMKVVDELGNALPRDGISPGEILVRTPWLTQGYFKDPERSEALWKDGWLHTGDIAVMDEEGFVRITDRLKDMVKSGGEWISSLELENLISQHEGVSEVAVIGVPNEKWGERPMALIVLKSGYKIEGFQCKLSNFLKQFVKEGKLSAWAVPDRVQVVEEIPKTSVGKINKRRIREMISQSGSG
jgi:fatty-acyl-CoA synthase